MNMESSVERYRVKTGRFASAEKYTCGLFLIPFEGRELSVLVSDGGFDGWEHVSVSLKNRNPNWREMCHVKDLFWDAEETVIQLHPPRSQWVNNHPYCLHMWRQIGKEVDLPPAIAVGFKELNVEEV